MSEFICRKCGKKLVCDDGYTTIARCKNGYCSEFLIPLSVREDIHGI